MSETALLSIRDLHFAYGAVPLFQGFDLEVRKGEVLGIVGPNGVGKSTLLGIISGTLKVEKGQVCLNGASVTGLGARQRAQRIAVVSQLPAAPQGFTALEMVLMGRNPHLGLFQWEGASDVEICRWAMELARCWELAQRPITSLSGGERQRVFIARALAQKPELLLLDEPTANLDIGYQPVIMDMLEEIREQALLTTIVAMHDLTLAAQYCHRMALLHRGKVLGLGPPTEVLTAEAVSLAFGVPVQIISHPLHGTPVVLPVGQRVLDGGRGTPGA